MKYITAKAMQGWGACTLYTGKKGVEGIMGTAVTLGWFGCQIARPTPQHLTSTSTSTTPGQRYAQQERDVAEI
jgi:hypothetical protein